MNKSLIRSKIKTIENIMFEASSANISHSKKIQYEYELLNIFELLFTSQLQDIESIDETSEDDNLYLSEEDAFQISQYVQNLKNEQSKFVFEKYRQGYRAIIPPMVSYRGKRSSLYFTRKKYVYYILEKLIKEYAEQTEIDKLKDATIILINHQSKTEHKNKIRDNDNSDSRDIVNIINRYLLSTDDNGVLVSLYYDSVVSETSYSYTELYVVPKVKSFVSKLAT